MTVGGREDLYDGQAAGLCCEQERTVAVLGVSPPRSVSTSCVLGLGFRASRPHDPSALAVCWNSTKHTHRNGLQEKIHLDALWFERAGLRAEG